MNQYNVTSSFKWHKSSEALIKKIYLYDIKYNLLYLVGRNHRVLLFADDTLLIFKKKRRLNIHDIVKNVFMKKVHWFSVHNLLLNSK